MRPSSDEYRITCASNPHCLNRKRTVPKGPVVCLGRSFPDDEARRRHFLDRLREKLADPAFRRTEGFPLGSDEDILALSDPPYFTACPNPFFKEAIEAAGRQGRPGRAVPLRAVRRRRGCRQE